MQPMGCSFWVLPRLSFYVGDDSRFPGHELSVTGADKKATYRAKYILLKVGSRAWGGKKVRPNGWGKAGHKTSVSSPGDQTDCFCHWCQGRCPDVQSPLLLLSGVEVSRVSGRDLPDPVVPVTPKPALLHTPGVTNSYTL